MPFNGTGMYVRVRNWVADAAAGIKIRADYHDIEDDGFADGLSHCIAKDGQTTITQNIPMNSKRLVALADPIDPQDAATKAYADLKLPLTGGIITGALEVTGGVTARGYKTREGWPGPAGVNWFNFNWTGSLLEAWIDTTNLGALATQAFATTTADTTAAAYAAPKVNRAGDTMGGLFNTAASGSLVSGGNVNSIVVYGSPSDWAAVSFVSPGVFGGNFGLHPNGNFYCGGWSFGAGVSYMFWTERNLTPVQNARLVNVGTVNVPETGQLYEPFGGAVVTGLIKGVSPFTTVTGARWRAMQLLTPGGWYTISYVG